jgi:hypothetical protein
MSVFKIKRKKLLYGILFFSLVSLSCQGEMKEPSIVDDFSTGADNWQPKNPGNWTVEMVNGTPAYRLLEPGKQSGIRKPGSWSTLKDIEVENFQLTVTAQCLTDTVNKRRDICLFFGFQDSTRFYYAHFSAVSDNVHNIIGIVDGADRVKINTEPAGESAARLTDYDWHELRIVRRVDSGSIEAFIDDMDVPVMTAKDTTFKAGQIGIGSFDDRANFDLVQLITTVN